MKDIWFVSDTHFGHNNILTFKTVEGDFMRPGFSSSEEMDEYMVEKWNSVVKDSDRVYHLGDVTFNLKNYIENIAPRLRGSKRLNVGNHDDIPAIVRAGLFKKVQLWRQFKEFDIVTSHFPLPEDQFRYKIKLNIHGHIHHNVKEGPYFNVCVEHHDYTPIHLDTILAHVKGMS